MSCHWIAVIIASMISIISWLMISYSLLISTLIKVSFYAICIIFIQNVHVHVHVVIKFTGELYVSWLETSVLFLLQPHSRSTLDQAGIISLIATLSLKTVQLLHIFLSRVAVLVYSLSSSLHASCKHFMCLGNCAEGFAHYYSALLG